MQTDTASVLHEASIFIKVLRDQIEVINLNFELYISSISMVYYVQMYIYFNITKFNY